MSLTAVTVVYALYADSRCVRIRQHAWNRRHTGVPCTFGLSIRPALDAVADFFAACDTGDAYLGDLTVVDCS